MPVATVPAQSQVPQGYFILFYLVQKRNLPHSVQGLRVLRTLRTWRTEDMVLLAAVFHFGHSKSFSLCIWNRRLIVLHLGSGACAPSAAWLFIMTYGYFPLPFNSYIVGNKSKPSPSSSDLFPLLKGFRVHWDQKELAATMHPKPNNSSRELPWKHVYAMDSLHPHPSPKFSQTPCTMALLLRTSPKRSHSSDGGQEAASQWHQTYWQEPQWHFWQFARSSRSQAWGK